MVASIGDKTPVQAACSLCPAWDVSQVEFHWCQGTPIIERILSVNHTYSKIWRFYAMKEHSYDFSSEIVLQFWFSTLTFSFYFRAFKNLRKYYPTVDDHLLESVNELFLKKNFKLLNDKFPKVMKTCSQSIDVQQFFDSHYPFAGR